MHFLFAGFNGVSTSAKGFHSVGHEHRGTPISAKKICFNYRFTLVFLPNIFEYVGVLAKPLRNICTLPECCRNFVQILQGQGGSIR